MILERALQAGRTLISGAMKAASGAISRARHGTLSGVDSGRGWISLFSSNTRGFQSDEKFSQDSILSFSPVYSCVTLIASDIGKICLQLKSKVNGIWVETPSPAFSPVLRKPNHFQTRQQFIELWVISKLVHGNAYILKIRDNRKVVVALYVLDPNRVTPLVAQDGSIYYQIQSDDLSKLPFDMPAVPASEIIHDRMECLFHPLIGISPLYAANLPASQGLRIQNNSEVFFKNMSRPSGMLTAPGHINDDTAARIKKHWEDNYSGGNVGRLAVLGDNLQYSAMTVTAVDAQLVDQLKLSAEQICSAFRVPPYMIGAGEIPTAYNNAEPLNQQYYSQCLQKMFNSIEDLLDDGLGLSALGYRTEFDLDDLIRMDSATRIDSTNKQVGGGWLKPNEARERFGLSPVVGGDSPMLQQQNYSLEALAKRDAQEDPFKSSPSTAGDSPAMEDDADAKAYMETARFIAALTKGLDHV